MKQKFPARGFFVSTVFKSYPIIMVYNIYMAKLSISVMAHPSRKEFFEYLKSKLGDVRFSIDEGKGLILNCRNAWSMYDPTADFHVVIQDDAIVCENFRELAENFLDKFPDMPVSFFHTDNMSWKKRRRDGLRDGYIKHSALGGGVALCLPTKLIPEMLMMYDELLFKADDHRVGHFVLKKRLEWHFPIPTLIDHRIGNMSICWKTQSKYPSPLFVDNKI